MTTAPLTHAELVRRTVRWARNTRGYPVALAEFVSAFPEVPDVIAFNRAGWSVLFECKVSRSDFARDAKKPRASKPNAGMGAQRYYVTPPGLVRPPEIPEGWGLIEVHARKLTVVKESAPRQDYDRRAELSVLASAVQRWQLTVPFDAENGRFASLNDPHHPHNQLLSTPQPSPQPAEDDPHEPGR